MNDATTTLIEGPAQFAPSGDATNTDKGARLGEERLRDLLLGGLAGRLIGQQLHLGAFAQRQQGYRYVRASWPWRGKARRLAWVRSADFIGNEASAAAQSAGHLRLA
jgi:hypothetical protein